LIAVDQFTTWARERTTTGVNFAIEEGGGATRRRRRCLKQRKKKAKADEKTRGHRREGRRGLPLGVKNEKKEVYRRPMKNESTNLNEKGKRERKRQRGGGGGKFYGDNL